MELSDLLSHSNSVSSAMHTHWNFFSVVVLAVITGLAIRKEILDKPTGIILFVALVMFLSSNLLRINKTVDELKVIQVEIQHQIALEDVTPDFESFYTVKYSVANSCWKLFHFTIDIILILILAVKTDLKISLKARKFLKIQNE